MKNITKKIVWTTIVLVLIGFIWLLILKPKITQNISNNFKNFFNLNPVSSLTWIQDLTTTTWNDLLFWNTDSEQNLEINNEYIFDTFVYNYQDSSVPPEYHRSYTIEISKDSLNLVVDSYGDIINEFKKEISSNEWNWLIETYIESRIKNIKKTVDDWCTGWHWEKIEFFLKSKKIFSWYNYYCAWETFGNIKWDIEKIKKYLIWLVPNFSDNLK